MAEFERASCAFNNGLLASGHLDVLMAGRVIDDKCSDRGTCRFGADEAVLWDEHRWTVWMVLAAGIPEAYAKDLAPLLTRCVVSRIPLDGCGATGGGMGAGAGAAVSCRRGAGTLEQVKAAMVACGLRVPRNVHVAARPDGEGRL